MKNPVTRDRFNPLVSRVHIHAKDGSHHEILVDTEDVDKLRIIGPTHSWSLASKSKAGAREVVCIVLNSVGKGTRYKAARLVLGLTDSSLNVSVVNGNPLDLRKVNLKVLDKKGGLSAATGKRACHRIIIEEDHAVVRLAYKGGFVDCKIDIEDVELIKQHPYTFQPQLSKRTYGDDTLYACALVEPASGARIRMHRLIMNAPEGVQVDHINGDGLDNRKANLRLVTGKENAQNKKCRRPTKCAGYPNVYKVTLTTLEVTLSYPLTTEEVTKTKYEVRVKAGRAKTETIGTFDSLEKAVEFRTTWFATEFPHSREARGEGFDYQLAA